MKKGCKKGWRMGKRERERWVKVHGGVKTKTLASSTFEEAEKRKQKADSKIKWLTKCRQRTEPAWVGCLNPGWIESSRNCLRLLMLSASRCKSKDKSESNAVGKKKRNGRKSRVACLGRKTKRNESRTIRRNDSERTRSKKKSKSNRSVHRVACRKLPIKAKRERARGRGRGGREKEGREEEGKDGSTQKKPDCDSTKRSKLARKVTLKYESRLDEKSRKAKKREVGLVVVDTSNDSNERRQSQADKQAGWQVADFFFRVRFPLIKMLSIGIERMWSSTRIVSSFSAWTDETKKSESKSQTAFEIGQESNLECGLLQMMMTGGTRFHFAQFNVVLNFGIRQKKFFF